MLRTAALLAVTRTSERHRRTIRHSLDRAPACRSAASRLQGEKVIAAGLASGIRLAPGTPPLDHVHAQRILRGNLEIPVQEALRRTLTPGATFYDIGANIGFFALLAARLVGPHGHVVAFEPVTESAASLRGSAASNGFTWLAVRDEAVGAAAGYASLCVVDDPAWSHLSSRGRHARTQREDRVPVVALDDLVHMGRLPPPDVIKIDVEGAELEVLAGMSSLLAHHRPLLICELHATNAEFDAAMLSHGYTTENLDGPADVLSAGPNIHALARAAPS
jgi:FkbM family methyltransferase